MQQIKKLKLTDIINKTIGTDAMSKLKGGIDIMPLGYGCTSDICSTQVNTSFCQNAAICQNSVCTSGVAPK